MEFYLSGEFGTYMRAGSFLNIVVSATVNIATRLPLFGGRDVSFESARCMEEDVTKRIHQHYQTPFYARRVPCYYRKGT